MNLILVCQKESIIPNSLKIFSNTNNLSFVKPINKTRQQEIKEQMKGSTPFKKFGLFITVIAENLKLLNKDKNDFKQRLKKMRDYQEKISHKNKGLKI